MASDSQTPSISSYVEKLVGDLRQRLPLAIRQGDVTAIHHSRVITRRLKAAIDLVEPLLTPRLHKRLGRALRRMRRRLGALRDADVMLGHLRERWTARHGPAAEWLIRSLTEQREHLAAECRERMPVGKALASLGWSMGVVDELQQAGSRPAELLAKSVPGQLAAFASQAQSLDLAAAGQDPHAIRIAGKRLRYTLEMALETGAPLGKSAIKTFKKLQDALGLWHDHVVLMQTVLRASADQTVAYHDRQLQGQILGLARAAWARAETCLRRFGVLWQAHGPGLIQQIGVVFPVARADDAPAEPPSLAGEDALAPKEPEGDPDALEESDRDPRIDGEPAKPLHPEEP